MMVLTFEYRANQGKEEWGISIATTNKNHLSMGEISLLV
jgi:hypothetical protein